MSEYFAEKAELRQNQSVLEALLKCTNVTIIFKPTILEK